jgi:hypothetical protein
VNLQDLPRQFPAVADLGNTDAIKVIIWWAHTYGGQEWVDSAYLRSSYGLLNRTVPVGGFAAYLKSLTDRKPPHLIKSKSGHKLEYRALTVLSSIYGQRDSTVRVEKLLTELPAKLSSESERSYLEETLICFRHKAFRAAVIMAWNLTYDHFCHWIIRDPNRLADFNAQTQKTFAKRNYPAMTRRDGFEEMKESEVLQVAASASIITGNLYKLLKEKLDRRNISAHPSDLKMLQSTAEEVIRELIENVVLRLV